MNGEIMDGLHGRLSGMPTPEEAGLHRPDSPSPEWYEGFYFANVAWLRHLREEWESHGHTVEPNWDTSRRSLVEWVLLMRDRGWPL